MKRSSHGTAVLYVGKPGPAVKRLIKEASCLDVRCVDIVPTLADAEQALFVSHPNVLLLSVQPPGTAEHRAIYTLRQRTELPPLVLMCPAPASQLTLLALCLGARECVSESVSAYNLADTLRACSHNGNGHMLASRHKLCQAVVEALRLLPPPVETPPPNPLSAREQEVLTLAAQGATNREIAAALVLQEQTVKNHVSTVLRKVGAKNREEAAATALRDSWIESP